MSLWYPCNPIHPSWRGISAQFDCFLYWVWIHSSKHLTYLLHNEYILCSSQTPEIALPATSSQPQDLNPAKKKIKQIIIHMMRENLSIPQNLVFLCVFMPASLPFVSFYEEIVYSSRCDQSVESCPINTGRSTLCFWYAFLTKHEVEMAEYWQSPSFCLFVDETNSGQTLGKLTCCVEDFIGLVCLASLPCRKFFLMKKWSSNSFACLWKPVTLLLKILIKRLQ